MTSLHFGNSCVFWLLLRLKTRTSHVSICVFHCGPAGREVEIFVEALSYRGPPLVGDVLHTHGRKTAPCKFKIPGRLLRSNPIVIPSLNSSAYSAEVPCL